MIRTLFLILSGLVLFFHQACEGGNPKKRGAVNAGIVAPALIHHAKKQRHEYVFPKEDELSEEEKEVLEKLTATLITTMPTDLIKLIAKYVNNFSVEAIAYINPKDTCLQNTRRLDHLHLEVFEHQQDDQIPTCNTYYFTESACSEAVRRKSLDYELRKFFNMPHTRTLREGNDPAFNKPFKSAPLLTINTICMAAVLLGSKLALAKRDNPLVKKCQENSLILYASSTKGLETGLPVELDRIYTYLKTEKDTREITSFYAVDSIHGKYADTVLEKYPLMRKKLEQLRTDTTGELVPVFYNGESFEATVQATRNLSRS